MNPDDPEDDVSDRPVQDLEGDVPLDANLTRPPDATPAALKKEEAEATEAVQRNKLRTTLFWIIVVLLIVSYASTTVMMWIYLVTQDFGPDPRIMVAWIGASVVQLIGLTFVITRYLFPPGR